MEKAPEIAELNGDYFVLSREKGSEMVMAIYRNGKLIKVGRISGEDGAVTWMKPSSE